MNSLLPKHFLPFNKSTILGTSSKHFTFGSKYNQPISTPVTSRTITVKIGGVVTPDSGLTWSKNGSAFSASAGTVVAGDKIQVKLTSAAVYYPDPDSDITLNLTINGTAFPLMVVTMFSGFMLFQDSANQLFQDNTKIIW
jgi:hypothetical protein